MKASEKFLLNQIHPHDSNNISYFKPDELSVYNRLCELEAIIEYLKPIEIELQKGVSLFTKTLYRGFKKDLENFEIEYDILLAKYNLN